MQGPPPTFKSTGRTASPNADHDSRSQHVAGLRRKPRCADSYPPLLGVSFCEDKLYLNTPRPHMSRAASVSSSSVHGADMENTGGPDFSSPHSTRGLSSAPKLIPVVRKLKRNALAYPFVSIFLLLIFIFTFPCINKGMKISLEFHTAFVQHRISLFPKKRGGALF